MGRKKTTELDAATTKARIIDTAEQLFRAMGYAKTTVADIAKVLGMSPANVYRYFQSKAAINEAICDRIVHHIESRCWEALVKDGTAAERLTRFIQEYHNAIIASIIKEKRLYDMIAAAMDEHWDVIQKHSDRVCDLVRIVLEQGIAAGEFRPMPCARMATAVYEALAFFVYPSLVEHSLNDASSSGQPTNLQEELDQLLDLILHGLRARA